MLTLCANRRAGFHRKRTEERQAYTRETPAADSCEAALHWGGA